MPQILRTVLIPDEAQAADGSPSFDLPVNPLSCVLLTVQALNETSQVDDYSSLSALLSMITDVRISYRGASIIQGSLTDLAVIMAAMTGWGPQQSNKTSMDNDVRSITVPLLFGRRPYDAMECFPATRRGDLVMQLTVDVAVAGHDNLVLQAETIELLEAEPQRFTKITTTSKIHNAVSEHDIELPIGNDLLGVLLHGPVAPTGAARSASFGSLALEVDNVETIYSETRWESMRADLMRRLIAWPERPHVHHMARHVHVMNAAGSTFPTDGTDTALTAVGNVLSIDGIARAGITGIQPPAIAHTLEQEESFGLLDNYALLDFDPTRDGSYAFKTAGAARVNLRVTSEVGSGTAVRVLPIELVPIGGAPAAA